MSSDNNENKLEQSFTPQESCKTEEIYEWFLKKETGGNLSEQEERNAKLGSHILQIAQKVIKGCTMLDLLTDPSIKEKVLEKLKKGSINHPLLELFEKDVQQSGERKIFLQATLEGENFENGYQKIITILQKFGFPFIQSVEALNVLLEKEEGEKKVERVLFFMQKEETCGNTERKEERALLQKHLEEVLQREMKAYLQAMKGSTDSISQKFEKLDQLCSFLSNVARSREKGSGEILFVPLQTYFSEELENIDSITDPYKQLTLLTSIFHFFTSFDFSVNKNLKDIEGQAKKHIDISFQVLLSKNKEKEAEVVARLENLPGIEKEKSIWLLEKFFELLRQEKQPQENEQDEVDQVQRLLRSYDFSAITSSRPIATAMEKVIERIVKTLIDQLANFETDEKSREIEKKLASIHSALPKIFIGQQKEINGRLTEYRRKRLSHEIIVLSKKGTKGYPQIQELLQILEGYDLQSEFFVNGNNTALKQAMDIINEGITEVEKTDTKGMSLKDRISQLGPIVQALLQSSMSKSRKEEGDDNIQNDFLRSVWGYITDFYLSTLNELPEHIEKISSNNTGSRISLLRECLEALPDGIMEKQIEKKFFGKIRYVSEKLLPPFKDSCTKILRTHLDKELQTIENQVCKLNKAYSNESVENKKGLMKIISAITEESTSNKISQLVEEKRKEYAQQYVQAYAQALLDFLEKGKGSETLLPIMIDDVDFLMAEKLPQTENLDTILQNRFHLTGEERLNMITSNPLIQKIETTYLDCKKFESVWKEYKNQRKIEVEKNKYYKEVTKVMTL